MKLILKYWLAKPGEEGEAEPLVIERQIHPAELMGSEAPTPVLCQQIWQAEAHALLRGSIEAQVVEEDQALIERWAKDVDKKWPLAPSTAWALKHLAAKCSAEYWGLQQLADEFKTQLVQMQADILVKIPGACNYDQARTYRQMLSEALAEIQDPESDKHRQVLVLVIDKNAFIADAPKTIDAVPLAVDDHA